MRVIFLAAASALVLGAAACTPHVDYAARTSLDCPERQGDLIRTSVSPDRKTCAYRSDDKVEVTLRLMPVSGDAAQTLSAIEASLVGPSSAPVTPKPPKTPETPVAPASSATRETASQAARQAAADAAASGASEQDRDERDDRTVIIGGRGHGVEIDGGDHAHINLPGLHIEADNDRASVDVGGIRIDAADDQTTVHIIREVRLRGQAFSRHRNGLRATFIAKRNNLPGGYNFVGYEASGPKTGPLTVALVKSRASLEDDNGLNRDVRRLVRRNGGA